jgi:hypothetical protein
VNPVTQNANANTNTQLFRNGGPSTLLNTGEIQERSAHNHTLHTSGGGFTTYVQLRKNETMKSHWSGILKINVYLSGKTKKARCK